MVEGVAGAVLVSLQQLRWSWQHSEVHSQQSQSDPADQPNQFLNHHRHSKYCFRQEVQNAIKVQQEEEFTQKTKSIPLHGTQPLILALRRLRAGSQLEVGNLMRVV